MSIEQNPSILNFRLFPDIPKDALRRNGIDGDDGKVIAVSTHPTLAKSEEKVLYFDDQCPSSKTHQF